MSDRLIILLFISILLLIIDWYIFKALVSLKIKIIEKRRKTFTWLYWGYSIILILGVFAGIYFNIKLTARAVILVTFFLSVVTKVCFLPFLFIDDIRRGIIWLSRKSGKKKLQQEVHKTDEDNI